MGRRMRKFVIASLVIWALVATAWILLLASENMESCPDFDISAGSPAASSYWKWLPPGRECVYEVDGQTHVDGPPDARLGELALLLAWPVATIGVARLAVLDRADEPEPNRVPEAPV
jgi:hypothetical protein